VSVFERLGGSQQRRTVRLLAPTTQLRLPVCLLLISALFAAAFVANGYVAYADLYSLAMAQVPYAFHETIEEQTDAFLVVSALIAVGWAAAILVFALAYTHRLVGPTIAFRRYLAALRNGDYSGRLALRGDDATFREITRSLNELAAKLEHDRMVARSKGL
jgi:hypothetical protein